MKIFVSPKAKKALLKIPAEIRSKIINQIDLLSSDPFPRSAKKLTNQPGYRIRVGDYRVLYLVDVGDQNLYIIKIAHRREVYR